METDPPGALPEIREATRLWGHLWSSVSPYQRVCLHFARLGKKHPKADGIPGRHGPEPLGESGHPAQLVRKNVPRFLHVDWRKATKDENTRAWVGYCGYFGTFSIDEDKQLLFTTSRAAGFRTERIPSKLGPSDLKKDSLRWMPTRNGTRCELSGRRWLCHPKPSER